jgi:AbrB family looped-hinge helix DNA binding protein
MVDKEVKLNSKHQIFIHKEAREYLDLKAGDRLVIAASTGGHLLLWKKTKR